MGNAIPEPTKKPLTIHDLTVKVGEYESIHEGDPQMKEDPEFPLHMMHEAMNKNNTIEGNAVQGTYVYYPNKDKPKMWIGNYKIINPEDILCKDVAKKIGMSEAQWKKYVEHKRDGKPLAEEYENFDLGEEHKEKLNGEMQNGAKGYLYGQFANENEHNRSRFNTGGLNEHEYSENVYNNQELYPFYGTSRSGNNVEQLNDLMNNGLENNYTGYSKNIYGSEDINDEEIKDHDSYIKRLNEEANRIRQAQEEEIYQQQRDLMYYGNMNMGNGTVVTVRSNNILAENETMPTELFDDEELEHLEEDEVAELGENIYVTNFNDQSHETLQEEEQMEEKEKIIKPGKNEVQKQKTQPKKKGKAKEEPIKAKVNSFSKRSNTVHRVETFSKKNPVKSYRSLATASTKSSIGMNKSKIATANKNKNLKNTTLKKAIA